MGAKNKKIVFYANFPITPTPGYLTFFNRIFREHHLTLVDANNPRSADIAICFNHTDQNLKKIENSGIDKKNRFLIMYECAQILPDMHKNATLEQYGHIYTPSPHWATRFSTTKIKYPFHIRFEPESVKNSKRQIKIGIVQRNLLSCIKGENYTLRRRIIKARRDVITVAGEGWRENIVIQYLRYIKLLKFYVRKVPLNELVIFPKYLISDKNIFPVVDKQKFLEDTEFAIIIENHSDYVSEKIFDCFRAGAVPIYFGPDLDVFDIPNNTIIPVTSFEGLIEVIDNISKFNPTIYQQNALNFLNSAGQLWDEERVLFDLAEKIIDDIN